MWHRNLAPFLLVALSCNSSSNTMSSPTAPVANAIVAGVWTGDATLTGSVPREPNCWTITNFNPLGAAKAVTAIATQSGQAVEIKLLTHPLLNQLVFKGTVEGNHLLGTLAVDPETFAYSCSPLSSFSEARPLTGTLDADLVDSVLAGSFEGEFEEVELGRVLSHVTVTFFISLRLNS